MIIDQKTAADLHVLREFAKWVLQEGPFEGHDLDGCDVQEKAVALGLIVLSTTKPDWWEYSPILGGPQ